MSKATPGSTAERRQNLADIEATLRAALERKTNRRIEFFEPYAKQIEFFSLGKTMRERLLMAGNQLGKTEAGAVEMVYHLTGIYPKDWQGRRWDRPVKAWACGEGSTLVRDTQQKKLCGEPGVADALGTGYIPKHLFVDTPSLARGVTDAYDTIQVRHISGGVSVLKFKSYEQGRAKFQGDTVDIVWLDEEPPMDIYSEALTRTNATKGMLYMTFTPLKGMSSVVLRYLNEESADRAVVMMTIEDALHISPEERAKIIASYPAHERDARTKGTPMLGSGRIFQYSDDAVSEAMIEDVPRQWVKLWGIDFGIDHPFAAALIAWDKDADIIHLLHVLRIADQKPLQHAAAMKITGRSVKVAWPQDGNQRDKGSLEQIAAQYRGHGLAMLPNHATWPDGSVSTEAGVMEMDERFATGRLKVASHLSMFFEEFRLYHRKDGLIVKLKDDILSALRTAIMMKRFATAVALGNVQSRRRSGQIAEGVDFDLFA